MARQRVIALSLALIGLLSLARSTGANESVGFADVVFLHGAIYTVDAARSWASTAAVRGSDLVYVGNESGVKDFVGRSTRIIDLHGRMLLPGFQDSHLHPTVATNPNTHLNLTGLFSAKSVLQHVADFARAHPKLTWIVGTGLEPGVFAPSGLPNRTELDKTVPGRPVLLLETSHHMAAANSKALSLSGVTAATPNPINGEIGRDSNGRLNGGLYEKSAMDLVSAHVPQPTNQQRIANLSWSLQTMLESGITAAEDAAATPDVAQTYKALADSNALIQRINLCLLFDASRGDDEQFAEFVEQRRRIAGSRLTAGCIKIFLDGGYANHGWFLLEPYSDDPAAHNRGQLTMDPARLNRVVTRFAAAGFQIHMHANGDAAVRAGLDALSTAHAVIGEFDNRPTIAHLAQVAPDDLDRFRRLGVVANLTPVWSRGDEWETEVAPRFFGPRAARNYPIRSLLNSGAVLVWGTDWPVTTLSPCEGIETAVTHRFPGGVAPSGKPDHEWNPDQRVVLEQAITAYTAAGAYLMHEENHRGSIRVGQAADLIVLDKNLFDLPAPDIHTALVDLTMINGRIAYERAATSASSTNGGDAVQPTPVDNMRTTIASSADARAMANRFVAPTVSPTRTPSNAGSLEPSTLLEPRAQTLFSE